MHAISISIPYIDTIKLSEIKLNYFRTCCFSSVKPAKRIHLLLNVIPVGFYSIYLQRISHARPLILEALYVFQSPQAHCTVGIYLHFVRLNCKTFAYNTFLYFWRMGGGGGARAY